MADAFLMKGKVYGEHKHKLVYPAVAEIKYDEIRLHVKRTASGVLFLSYAGKELHNLGDWHDRFYEFMQEQGVHNLDMGVLVNGNFNDSYRWCRSSTGAPREKLDKATGKVAPALDEGMVKFYLFDIPDYKAAYRDRSVSVDRAAHYLTQHYGVPTDRPKQWRCDAEAELDALFVEVREKGFEGLMVKTLTHTYECGKRIDGWLKMKPEETADGKITRVNQAFSIEGVPLDRAGSVDVVLEDFSTAAPAGIPHELGRLMWANPQDYVGKQWVEFKYMERDRQGGYRHPSLVRLREAKE